ncbi:hypothetical protein HG531_011114 [Fusarium graminearum]|nr:hypothetical protein HG531_011114 [Fusarium graminearum]
MGGLQLTLQFLNQLALLAAIGRIAVTTTGDILQLSTLFNLLAQLIFGKKCFDKLGLLGISLRILLKMSTLPLLFVKLPAEWSSISGANCTAKQIVLGLQAGQFEGNVHLAWLSVLVSCVVKLVFKTRRHAQRTGHCILSAFAALELLLEILDEVLIMALSCSQTNHFVLKRRDLSLLVLEVLNFFDKMLLGLEFLLVPLCGIGLLLKVLGFVLPLGRLVLKLLGVFALVRQLYHFGLELRFDALISAYCFFVSRDELHLIMHLNFQVLDHLGIVSTIYSGLSQDLELSVILLLFISEFFVTCLKMIKSCVVVR